MPRWFLALALVPLFVIASFGQPPTAPPPRRVTERDAFFREGKIPTLVLEFDKKSADSLRREPRTYVKAKLTDGDKVYVDVGVHLKGAAGSWRGFDDKP